MSFLQWIKERASSIQNRFSSDKKKKLKVHFGENESLLNHRLLQKKRKKAEFTREGMMKMQEKWADKAEDLSTRVQHSVGKTQKVISSFLKDLNSVKNDFMDEWDDMMKQMKF